jgi:predicted peptidase
MKKQFVASTIGACFLLAGTIVLNSCQDREPEPALKAPEELAAAATNPLDLLPKDTGGKHVRVTLGSNASPYGYYLYTPSGYKATGGPKFPLLIFLHGAGEAGNSQQNPANLDLVLRHGPPKMVKNKTWKPKYPMVVVSAQTHERSWTAAKVKLLTEFVMKTYAVDTLRIYMTGLSMGAVGTWNEISIYGKGSHITAAVPIAGMGVNQIPRAKKAGQMPVWAFHGNNDTTVKPDFDKVFVPIINAQIPAPKVKAKVTIYPNTGHDSWTRTYDGTGRGKEDPAYDRFNMDIYTWMFQYKK